MSAFPIAVSDCAAYTRMYVGDVIGYAFAPLAFNGSNVRSGLTVAPSIAAVAPEMDAATYLPDAFLIAANLRFEAFASEKST